MSRPPPTSSRYGASTATSTDATLSDALTSDLLAEPPASIRPHKAVSARGEMKQRPTSSGFVTLGSWLLFATVALAPLPFGSNLPTAIAFWCIVLGAAIVFASPEVNA